MCLSLCDMGFVPTSPTQREVGAGTWSPAQKWPSPSAHPRTILQKAGPTIILGSPAPTHPTPCGWTRGREWAPPHRGCRGVHSKAPLLQAAKLHAHLRPQDTTATSLFVWVPGGRDPAPEGRESRCDLHKELRQHSPEGMDGTSQNQAALHSMGFKLFP